MEKAKGKFQAVNLKDLTIYPENPRIFPVENEEEAIYSLCYDDGDKLINLAETITKNGLSPLELIGIFKFGKDLIVKEGNRRVTCLKLLNDPTIIENDFPKLYKKFLALSSGISLPFIQSFFAWVSPSEKDLDYWSRIKHLGEQQGVGTLKWTTIQKQRNLIKTGKSTARMNFILEMISKGYVDENVAFEQITYTNWGRILSGTSMPFYGIIKENGMYIIANKELFDIVFPTLIDRLKGGTVGVVYDEKIQLEFFRKIYNDLKIMDILNTKAKNAQTALDLKDKAPIVKPEIKQNTTLIKTKSKKLPNIKVPIKYLANRATLIPNHHMYKTNSTKINKIIYELKSLNVGTYSISVGLLFRLFIELSFRDLASKSTYTFKENQLCSNYNGVVHFLFPPDVKSKEFPKIRATLFALSKKMKIFDILSGISHYDSVSVPPKLLKETYDSMGPLFDKIFNYN